MCLFVLPAAVFKHSFHFRHMKEQNDLKSLLEDSWVERLLTCSTIYSKPHISRETPGRGIHGGVRQAQRVRIITDDTKLPQHLCSDGVTLTWCYSYAGSLLTQCENRPIPSKFSSCGITWRSQIAARLSHDPSLVDSGWPSSPLSSAYCPLRVHKESENKLWVRSDTHAAGP